VRKLIIGGVILSMALGSFGCASKTGTGAVVGAAGGALVGGALGSAKGNAGKGAVAGALVGGIGGALVGNSMDQADKDRELKRLREEQYQRSRGYNSYDDRRADYRDGYDRYGR
jgi:uncharacterized protein YcfJ